ncbi:hypothetical protein B0H13DRAFT_2654903 [Mycena leptocephala]|nr:hypothetical protein B0H13DRAFT_2654903 [Mycena leptocephala]
MTAASSIFIAAWSPLLIQTKYTGPSCSPNYVSKFDLMPHHRRRRISIIAVPLHWLAPATPFPSRSTPSERLIARHQRLEALLESALATLALIHDAGGPASYSDHVLDVVAALGRHIAAPIIATPLPNPLPDLTTAANSAHYLAATPNAPVPVPVDDTKRSHVSYARATSAEPRRHLSPSPKTSQPDIVVRFTDATSGPPRRPNPAVIYDAIHDTLSPTCRLFAGLEPDTGTASFMIDKYASRIWEIIRPLLDFPEGHPAPAFETGDPWHSVVQGSLELGGYYHPVKAISVLCTDEELTRRYENGIRVSLRVTVETRALCRNWWIQEE